MVQKTKRQRKSHTRSRSRSRRRSNETETQTSPLVDIVEQKQEQMPIVENHHYYSKMFFDGNTIVTESQKDDEPVKRRKYTLKRLEREIPIGADLVKAHLKRKVPPALNAPFPKDIEFTSVLPNPIDLGLMPPSQSHYDLKNHGSRSRSRSRSHSRRHGHDNEENIKLLVNELS